MSQFVKDYYNQNAVKEWGRLDGPKCKIEFSSTLSLINKYFPAQGCVCDIGGGPGRYTIELAQRGYQVTLFDLSEAEICLAREHLEQMNLHAELMVGDARDLSQFADEMFDAGLLLGPMYHVVDPQERLHILRQLHRILKPGGAAIIAYLNCWGLIKTGVVDFPHWYSDINTLRSMLNEKSFPGSILSGFTESYWATPTTALREVEAAGFRVVSYAGVESFACGMTPLLEQLKRNNPESYANLVEVAAETCELPQYRDTTDHLHIVVQK